MYLGHPRLLVLNFAECFRFYRDVMDFQVTWGNENDSYAAFTDREGQETTLALFRREGMAEVVGTAALPAEAICQDRVALIVEVEDVDGVFETLSEQGVEFVVKPEDYVDWGIRGAYLRDPDGNLIELSGSLERFKWSPGLEEAARQYGRAQAIDALSDGVDSATVIALGHRALGGRLRTAFVDNGLMREGEPEQIQTAFGRLGFPPKPPSTMEVF